MKIKKIILLVFSLLSLSGFCQTLTKDSILFKDEFIKQEMEEDDDGNPCLKIEPIEDINYVKNDTTPYTELEMKIITELASKTYNKQKITKRSETVVGVLMDGSCGIYPILDIFMDCEDRNPKTESFGWVGSSYVTGNRNVHLKFCIITTPDFVRTNFDYAVLKLSSNLTYGISQFVRFFDNEDGKDNTNKVTINGKEVSGWYNRSETFFGKNTRLDFYYFPKTVNYSPLPYLSISYGVFGRFGNYQGYIYTDDQDYKNINFLTKHIYREDLYGYKDFYDNFPIPNIIDVGKNTKLYISKITNCH